MEPVLKISVDGDIIHLTLEGELKDENLPEFKRWADNVHQTVLDFHKKSEQKVRFLTDASKLESMSEKIMNVYGELLKKDLPYVHRSATFGAKLNVLAQLTTLMIISHRPNFQHFKTKEEAVNWLMEK